MGIAAKILDTYSVRAVANSLFLKYEEVPCGWEVWVHSSKGNLAHGSENTPKNSAATATNEVHIFLGEHSVLISELQAFYVFLELPAQVEKAQGVIMSHSLNDIVRSLLHKYGDVPPRWKHEQLCQFYAEHNPAKIDEAAAIVAGYSIKSIAANLQNIYGAMPLEWEHARESKTNSADGERILSMLNAAPTRDQATARAEILALEQKMSGNGSPAGFSMNPSGKKAVIPPIPTPQTGKSGVGVGSAAVAKLQSPPAPWSDKRAREQVLHLAVASGDLACSLVVLSTKGQVLLKCSCTCPDGLGTSSKCHTAEGGIPQALRDQLVQQVSAFESAHQPNGCMVPICGLAESEFDEPSGTPSLGTACEREAGRQNQGQGQQEPGRDVAVREDSLMAELEAIEQDLGLEPLSKQLMDMF